MARASSRRQREIKKQRVWSTALFSLLLVLFMAVCVVCGMLFYAYNALETQLTAAKARAEGYAAAVDGYLLDSVNRVAVYADILERNYYGAPGSASLSVQLSSLKALDGFEDVGVIEGGGAVTSTDGLLTNAEAVSVFQRASAEKAQALLLFEGENRGVLFVSPIRRGNALDGVLYLADFSSLSMGAAGAPALFEADACCVLDGENRLIGYAGKQPESFDYEAVRKSGLLFSEGADANLREMLRAVKAASGAAAAEGGAAFSLRGALRDGTPLSIGTWFAADLSVNGWRTLLYVKKSLDAFTLRQAVTILLGAALLILLPLIFTARSTVLQLQANKKLSQALLFDPITSGNNFQYFRREAEKLLKKRKYRGKVLAFAVIDVDRFRAFSDVHGPGEGELLLVRIFNYLTKSLKNDELLARFSADQFSLLFIFEPEEDPAARVSRILRGLSRLYPGEKTACSAGIYVVQDRTLPADSMNNFASVAKDAAKRGGSGGVAFYDNAMREKLVFEQQVVSLMDRALKNAEFALYLQPKYAVADESLSGAEALVRWISPERGFISPDAFIPLFERSGFIVKLDAYMLKAAVTLQKRWQAEGRTLFPISVNVSRANFMDPGLAKRIKGVVDEAGVPYSCIELELTESAFFDDKQALLYTVNQLRRWGFAISMDDFGSGYSSLNALKDLPLDVIKLDRGFFLGTDDPDRGDTVVKSVISLAKKLGITVVAEGIETCEQVAFLRDAGCDLIQGFYYAKPMPVEEFERLAPFAARGIMRI